MFDSQREKPEAAEAHTSQPWQTSLSPPLECWYPQQVHGNQHPPDKRDAGASSKLMQHTTELPAAIVQLQHGFRKFSPRETFHQKTDTKLIAKYFLLHLYILSNSIVNFLMKGSIRDHQNLKVLHFFLWQTQATSFRVAFFSLRCELQRLCQLWADH